MERRAICLRHTDSGAGRMMLDSRAAIAALFLLVGLTMQLLVTGAQGQLSRQTLSVLTSAGTVAIDIEVADTPEQKAKGLMFRRSMPERAGMLFPYDRVEEITMWMRNTYIPLDMVFIRKDGVIHRIEEMTQPLSEEIVASKGGVTAVLELNGGAARRLGIKPGDRVVHPAFKPAKP